MFKRLHIQMTLFCLLITGAIMIGMSYLTLASFESSLKENAYNTFQNDVTAMVASMENQSVVSIEWISQMEKNGRYLISVSNNGVPLFYDELTKNQQRTEMLAKAESLALSEHNFTPASLSTNSVLVNQASYILHENGKEQYYITAANIPKSGYYIRIFVVYSLTELHRQIARQRLIFLAMDALGITLLFLFSYFFTKKMIAPIRQSQEQQVQFVAAASHELRTPLAVMMSSLSAMEKAAPADAAKFQQIMRSEGDRLAHLTDDLLTLARTDHANFQMQFTGVELDTLLLNLMEKFEPLAAQKDLTLSITLPPESSVTCTGDYVRLEQVFSILLDNAVSYTPAHGQIQIILRELPAKLEIRIADTGPGVPDDRKDLIWNRFYRLDASHTSRKHFGLGLSIAKELVKKHKGKIWVEDGPEGAGAVFVVTLPAGEHTPISLH